MIDTSPTLSSPPCRAELGQHDVRSFPRSHRSAGEPLGCCAWEMEQVGTTGGGTVIASRTPAASSCRVTGKRPVYEPLHKYCAPRDQHRQDTGPRGNRERGVGMDSQTIELVGQHRLASELLQAGLEVAFPARDRGVDLIAYADIDRQIGKFVAKPIQLKAASRKSFGIWSKYMKFHDLILAFVWNLGGSSETETYALTYPEAIAIGDAMGWTKTASWTEHGGYGTTRPGVVLCERLQPFRMTPDKWWLKVTGANRTTAGTTQVP
jgi:hypothetical protein